MPDNYRDGISRPTRTPCFAHQVKQCRGTCVGKEAVGVHRVRLLSALLKLKLTAWTCAAALVSSTSSRRGRTGTSGQSIANHNRIYIHN